MTLKTTITKFNFSYGELLEQALEKSTYLRRDETTLAQRGITTNNLDALDALISAFRETKEDSVYIAMIGIAIEKRDKKRKQVELIGRDILGIAEAVYGKKSLILKSFGFANAISLTDGKLLISADTLFNKANEHVEDLITRGFTTEMLSEFKTCIEELEPLVRKTAAIRAERDINTRNRHTVANNLYNEMITLCSIARNYYKDRDPARYADYFIHSQGNNAQMRTGTVAPKNIVSRSLTGLKTGLLFKLINEGPGPLEFYFSTTEGGIPITESYNLTEYQEKTLPIESLGYDLQTGSIKFNIRNSSDTESGYQVRIE